MYLRLFLCQYGTDHSAKKSTPRPCFLTVAYLHIVVDCCVFFICFHLFIYFFVLEGHILIPTYVRKTKM